MAAIRAAPAAMVAEVVTSKVGGDAIVPMKTTPSYLVQATREGEATNPSTGVSRYFFLVPCSLSLVPTVHNCANLIRCPFMLSSFPFFYSSIRAVASPPPSPPFFFFFRLFFV